MKKYLNTFKDVSKELLCILSSLKYKTLMNSLYSYGKVKGNQMVQKLNVNINQDTFDFLNVGPNCINTINVAHPEKIWKPYN